MNRVSESRLERSLPKDAYVAPEFFERERRAIFWGEWFCIGRAQSWADPGAYAVLEVVGESVIVVRDTAGELHAHYNLCRHRGSRILRGSGSLRGAIRCPYHGWCYAPDGRLIATPFVSQEDVPPQARRLHGVAVCEWGGFVFLHLSPDENGKPPVTLAEQLGPVPARLERYPLEALRCGRSMAYDVAGNWKVVLENYNECYHCAGVHPELCRIVPAFKAAGGAHLDWENGIPHREGAYTFTFSGTSARSPFPALNERERSRHNGELIYPNFMLSLCADHVAAFVLWPENEHRTRIVCDVLFHPNEMDKPDFDPSDAADFWDLINRQDWAVCERVQKGMQSRRFAFGYYAPMENASLDIRRYIAQRLGPQAVALD